jgi:uncharacterized alpha-E superfamily protein
VEFLLLDEEFPRAVRYCLASSLDAVSRISSDQGAPHRILGRLVANLEYGEAGDISGEGVSQTLRELLAGIHAAGEAVTKAYFSSRALPAGPLAMQEAQQQQCG